MALPAFPTAVVAFLAALNGNPFDATSNPEGLADGGHRPNFPLAMNGTADLANYFASLGTALNALADQVAADADSAAEGSGTEASVANIRSGASAQFMSIRRSYAAQEPAGLTDAATIAWDMAEGINFAVTLGGATRALANPSNPVLGKSGLLMVSQDAIGGRAITAWGSNFIWIGSPPTFPTAANAISLISYFILAPAKILLNYGGSSA